MECTVYRFMLLAPAIAVKVIGYIKVFYHTLSYLEFCGNADFLKLKFVTSIWHLKLKFNLTLKLIKQLKVCL